MLRCSILFLASVPLLAQDVAEDPAAVGDQDLAGGVDLLEGHSEHGEAFNEGPRQAAYLMENPSSVRFPVTAKSSAVQEFVDQGMGQLHGFWYLESERSFRQAAALDPDCAMAYWGMAMSNVDSRESFARAAAFAHEAWLRREGVTERERRYIDALAKVYDVAEEAPEVLARGAESADEDAAPPSEEERKKAADEERTRRKSRAQDFVADLERICFDWPDDIEAKALLVNQLWMNKRLGLPISSVQANEALLREIFAAEPMHPAHHYRIHLLDSKEHAAYAVDSAQLAGHTWPSVAHQWHMGGHIFARLGRHDDAAWQQEASARVDHAHMIRDRVLPDQIHNYAHNNEWLIRSWRHVGRVRDAIDLAKNMVELPRHPRWNTRDKGGTSAAWGRRRLFETLEQYELWSELVDLCGTMYLEPGEDAGDEGFRAYLLGQACANLRDEAGRAAQVARLHELIESEVAARAASVVEAEERALAEGASKSELREALAGALEAHESELADLRRKVRSLDALAQVLAATDAEAVETGLKALAEHSYDAVQLARLYSEAGLHEEALTRARDQAKDKDGQVVPRATLAYVLERAGEREEALEVFRELRETSARFDLDVPLFQRLAPLAAAEGLPADWRVPADTREDIRPRPDLDDLGPRRWTPPPALAWACPDMHGDVHRLDDHAGRPTLVILFLGMGCVHCVEQLQAFHPMAEEFAAAGIDLVAIGTDDVADLLASQGGRAPEDAYPFPVLADPRMEVFHAYRAYDDFEDMPLHGTFLIDGKGRVRWQDVSFEPFTEPEFLLAESVRLLGLPVDGQPVPGVPGRGLERAPGLGTEPGAR